MQKYDKPDLDQSKAEEFANTALLQTLREQNLELGIRSLGGSNLYPGVWVRVPTIALFSKKEVMYICGLATVIRPREPISFDLILKYSPPVPEIRTASGAVAGPVDLASIDAIGAKAATFKYSHGCSASACIESGGSGDCYAMSDWLYEKLTAIGVKSQIQWCSGPRNHRTVQIDVGSGWQDFDYGKYNIETMFRVSSSRSGCRVYR